MSMKPLILLSNDDGVAAKGLQSLITMLQPLGHLFVMAPDRARSGAACSITSEVPVRSTLVRSEDGLTVYSCTGTPVDCVKLALDQMLGRQPDLVVGGINHGSNATINVHYSGTMGVAIEGALQGLPAVAFSLVDQDPNADFSPLTPYVQSITAEVLRRGLPYGSCLNVNFPAVTPLKGVRMCRMGYSRWADEYTVCRHPRGGRYYWLGGECIDDEPDETDTDSWALKNDYVAITPVRVDVTDNALLDQLSDWPL